MLRYLPLLFLFVACARDPLSLEIMDTKEAVPEDGLLVIDGFSGGNLLESRELLSDHEDLSLRFSFRLKEGSKADVLFDGKHAFSLDRAQLPGIAPRTELSITEGIWQDLELTYKAASEDNPALLASAYLNGNLLYYQAPLEGEADGPLSIRVTSGEVDIADLRYGRSAGQVSTVDADGNTNLNVPLLRYELYQLPEGTTEVRNWASRTPMETGFINRFDVELLLNGKSNCALRFFGELNIPEAGEYKFNLWTPARAKAYLDGNEMLRQGGGGSTDLDTDSLRLAAGAHDIRVDYIQKGGWNRLNLAYWAGDEDKAYLNAMEERKTIARPGGKNKLPVELDDQPYLLRSFLYYPAPKAYEVAEKRTHVLSVGEGDGPHYSIDLQSGSLLQVWRGGFADVFEMWAGRGEPQVMKPLGNAISLDGRMQWADSAKENWPDFPELPEDDDFRHLAHELDEAGRPTFFYSFGPGQISDKIVPEGNGLLRELTFTAGGNPETFTQIAAARTITETAPGQFELRGPGMKISIESYDGEGLTLQRGGGMDRLIAQMHAKGHIRYRIDW